MNRSRTFSQSPPAQVNFSDIPPDIVQEVQVVQIQGQALTSRPPTAGVQVFFSENPPEITQDVQIVPTASALSTTPPTELANAIERSRAQGVTDEEIRQFLRKIGTAYTFALSGHPQGVTLALPGGKLLTPMQSELLLAVIASETGAAKTGLATVPMALLHQLPDIANRSNVTIGIGPALTNGIVDGATLGSGILFAPGNHVGCFGPLNTVRGAIVGINGTMQVTLLKGGLEGFGGNATALSASGGETIVGSVYELFRQDRFIGVSFAMDVSAGVAPIESYAKYEYAPTASE